MAGHCQFMVGFLKIISRCKVQYTKFTNSSEIQTHGLRKNLLMVLPNKYHSDEDALLTGMDSYDFDVTDTS